jgi:hypothetical protein
MLRLNSLAGLARALVRLARVRLPQPPAPAAVGAHLRRLAARWPLILRDAALLDFTGVGLLLVAAILLADPHAADPRTVLEFDRSPAARAKGLGETARISPSLDAKTEPFAERSPYGPLPRIAPDGRSPARSFARPGTPANGRPIISVLVTGLGLDEAATRAAIAKLPPEITLAFSPYSDALPALTDLARANGREYLLEVPVEPFDYPESDPGPLVLLADAAPIANIERLHHTLARSVGYFGILTSGAARFATAEAAIAPIAAEAAARGFALVDDGKSPVSKTPRIARQNLAISGAAGRRLDVRPSDEGLALALIELEQLAIEQGHAIGAAELYPVIVNRLAEWAAGLAAKGLVLQPVSVQILPAEPGVGADKPERSKHPS